MRHRGRGVAVLVAVAVVVLFAGRRLTMFLSDVWWAREFSPAGADFLAQWHSLRLLLDGSATLVACAWFIGNLFIVYRALGMVQVPRYLANLEFREAVTPNLLLAGAVLLGLGFGALAGSGASEWWPTVSLAWQGAPFELRDPLLNRDLGVYLTQLPMWRTLRAFAVLLLAVAAAVVILLYMLVGSLRWVEGRPAISDHARAHLGGLLAALALCLAWGYRLEPFELVAGLRNLPNHGVWDARSLGAQVMIGTTLAAAAVSVVWAFRPKHALLLAGWIVVMAAAVGHRFVVPALLTDQRPLASAEELRVLERTGFGLDSLVEREVVQDRGLPAAALPEAPWGEDRLEELVSVDSTRLLGSGATAVQMASASRPVWLIAAQRGTGTTFLTALAADRLGPGGGVTSYQPNDSNPYPSVLPYLELSPDALRPGGPGYRIDTGPGGVAAGSWFRRLVLAWGFQAGGLLREVPEGARVHWLLDPADRLRRLAPFAAWARVEPRVAGGRAVWVAYGYLTGEAFPLVPHLSWGTTAVGYVRPGFVGVVDARSGATRVYLAPQAGPLAQSWSRLSAGLVEPTEAIPADILTTLSYPREWFEAQTALLAREWRTVAPRPSMPGQDAVFRWRQPGVPTPVLQVALHEGQSRIVAALLEGWMEGGTGRLTLTRIDSAASLQTPAALRQRWGRLPLFEQLQDSLRREGATLQAGTVVYHATPEGLLAASPYYSVREGARPAMAWAALAAGDRLGAGRSFAQAWSNLVGATAPLPPGSGPPAALDEARRWMTLADSAFRAGDWETFGRAFAALREVLRAPDRPAP